MTLETVAYMIGGGAEHSEDMFRGALYDSTSGAEGVSSVEAFKVEAMPAADGQVRVAPGGALILNRYPGGEGQTYRVRNKSESIVNIPDTGGSPRVDYLCVVIEDPQFTKQPSPTPKVGPYVFFRLLSSITNLNYPFYHIGTIVRDANTTVVYQEDIDDPREIAIPRSKKYTFLRPNYSNDDGLTLTATRENGEWFPNANGNVTVHCPDYAVACHVKVKWEGVNTAANTNPYGAKWVEYGPGIGGLNGTQDRERRTQLVGFNSPKNGDVQRGDWEVDDTVYIPKDYRGKDLFFVLKARYNGADAGITMDGYSATAIELEFVQETD